MLNDPGHRAATPGPEDPARVLMVLVDTDRVDANLSALDLHGSLDASGLLVRTVALGPGRIGGLEHLVPTIAPSSGSPAAMMQLRRESHWADVVVCHGAHAARMFRLSRPGTSRATPAVVVLTDELDDTGPRDRTRPRRRSLLRSLRSARLIVLTDPHLESPTDAFGVQAARVRARPFGIGPIEQVTAHQRHAARAQLGLAERTTPVLWWVGRPGLSSGRELVRRWAEQHGVVLLMGGGRDDELVVAASDVAVWSGASMAGPPRELLRAAATGHALIMIGADSGPFADSAVGTAVAGDSSIPETVDEAMQALSEMDISAACDAARRAVRVEFAMDGVTADWLDMIGYASRTHE